MSREASSKTLFKVALRHSDIIDRAYFEHGGRIQASEELEPAINTLIKHRLAWQLDEVEGAQLSGALIKLLERTGSAARRSRGSDIIASLWRQLEELLEDYAIVLKKNRENELERLATDMHECTFELIESIDAKLTLFANYIEQGFSTVSDIELRLLHNHRALKEAETLNNILQGCDLKDFTLSTSSDPNLRKLFKIYLPKSLGVFRKELVRVLHDLRKLVTKLQADSQLSSQLISFRRHYEQNPGFVPTEIPFMERIPSILTQSVKASSFAYPDVQEPTHAETIVRAIALVKQTVINAEEIIAENIDIEDTTTSYSTTSDVGELYQKSLAVLEVVSSGQEIKASTSYEILDVSTDYNFWLLALLNTISGLEKKERESINVEFDSKEHMLFNGNHYVKDLTLSLC